MALRLAVAVFPVLPDVPETELKLDVAAAEAIVAVAKVVKVAAAALAAAELSFSGDFR